MFRPSGCKDIGVRKIEFVAKTQFFFENYKDFLFLKFLKNVLSLNT